VLTDAQRAEFSERVEIERENQAKLLEFLSREKKVEAKEVNLCLGQLIPNASPFITVERYADPVVQAFYKHVDGSALGLGKPKLIYRKDFDPQTAWAAFIEPYVTRFGAPKNAAKKPGTSRKGKGGRKELSRITEKFREVLEEAQEKGEVMLASTDPLQYQPSTLDLASLRTRVWKKLDPNKPEPKKRGNFQRDFLARVKTHIPQLSPGRGKNPSKSKH
jgi:hypothetical protein